MIGNGTSNVTFVAPGSNGNILTSNGTSWISQAGSSSGVSSLTAGRGFAVSSSTGAVTGSLAAGTILQVVTGTLTTSTTTTSTSYVDTGLTATITPQSTSSKILVITAASMYIQNNQFKNYTAVGLVRGSTVIQEYTQMVDMVAGSGGTQGVSFQVPVAIGYLDSPATTSATTYKVQIKLESTSYSATVTFNKTFNSITNTSTITLLEIAG